MKNDIILFGNHQTARKYRNKLKHSLSKKENQSVTNCHRLKIMATDGKKP